MKILDHVHRQDGGKTHTVQESYAKGRLLKYNTLLYDSDSSSHDFLLVGLLALVDIA